MKAFIILASILCLSAAIPYEDQMALTNSLIVGRADQSDVIEWVCKTCDASNKPIHSHIIEEKAVDIKCVVSVYAKFIILAFRYTNTALNVWQDVLYPLQVNILLLRLLMSIHVPTVRYKRHTTICGRR